MHMHCADFTIMRQPFVCVPMSRQRQIYNKRLSPLAVSRRKRKTMADRGLWGGWFGLVGFLCRINEHLQPNMEWYNHLMVNYSRICCVFCWHRLDWYFLYFALRLESYTEHNHDHSHCKGFHTYTRTWSSRTSMRNVKDQIGWKPYEEHDTLGHQYVNGNALIYIACCRLHGR